MTGMFERVELLAEGHTRWYDKEEQEKQGHVGLRQAIICFTEK